jgi:hypothetical protein
VIFLGSNFVRAVFRCSGDRCAYLAVIAIVLWPIRTFSVYKSIPAITPHDAKVPQPMPGDALDASFFARRLEPFARHTFEKPTYGGQSGFERIAGV